MAGDNPLGSARDEAERLVAAALAAAQFAARRAGRDGRREEPKREPGLMEDLGSLAGIASRFMGRANPPREEDTRSRRRDAYDDIDPRRRHRPTGFANGSEACCSCPVCRVIDMVRDPSPEFVQRVASGASDLASGVTAVLRAFGSTARPRTEPADVVVVQVDEVGAQDAAADTFVEDDVAEPFADGADFASVWQEATRAAETRRTPRPSGPPTTPKPMAKKTVKKAVKPAAHRPDPVMAEPRADHAPTSAEPSTEPSTEAVRRAVKKAIAEPAEVGAPAVPPKKAAPAKAVAKKAVAKKAAAKKAVAKRAGAENAAGETVVAKKAAGGQTAKAAKKTAKKTAKKAT